MNKELQDRAWSILPKEFKEGVKKEYYDDNSNPFELAQLEAIFGIHNLTSDAEGEEMLACEKGKVHAIYAYNEEILSADPTHSGAWLLKNKLTELFGPKCLPYEEPPLKITAAEDCIAMAKEEMGIQDEPKPAEPKFKVGDKVVLSPKSIKNGFWDEALTIKAVNSEDNTYLVRNKYFSTGIWLREDELIPCVDSQLINKTHMTTKEVQDQVWSSLPESFRKEIVSTYSYAEECDNDLYWKGIKEQLKQLFGKYVYGYKVGDTVVLGKQFLGEIVEIHPNYAKVKMDNKVYKYTYNSFKKVNPE